jgi:hypothetical protein
MTADLKFHPLADIFPLMEGEEFEALVADIKAHALRTKITLHEGKILDGRNRYRAMLAAGHTTPISSGHFFKYKSLVPGDTPLDYVIRANLHRRHLTAEQKREVIAKLLKAQPEKSDRQIGKMAKVSKNTAKSVRDEMEARGQIDHVETRTDTKGRKQPAKKSTKKTDAAKRAAEYRARKEQREHEADAAEWRAEIAALKAEAEQIAVDLIKLDRNLAQRLYAHLAGGESWLKAALGRGLELEGNGADASASADKRREQFAALDDGNDPGPIPECLRREPKATAP